MLRTGFANLPLHGGKAPRWLFKRMVLLSKGIVKVIIYEYGKDEFLRRISDPFWFQAFSCVMGYDWHSSGCTTVTCGALKAAINPEEFGLAITGGKGNSSKRAIEEIEQYGNFLNLSSEKIKNLQYSSRMAAKIDNAAVQDGYDLYHHVMIFLENGKWAVIQQGMNNDNSYARRYHWFSEQLNSFVCEPHNAIIGDFNHETVLDMTAKKSIYAQKISLDLVKDNPNHLKKDWAFLNRSNYQMTLDSWVSSNNINKTVDSLIMPKSINWLKMKEIYNFQPKNYEEMLSIKGVGSNTIRALALISDLIYGEKPSWSDPIKYSFAVGGKDGVPFPVDKNAMDKSIIEIIESGIEQAKIGNNEKLLAIKRLHNFLKNL